MESQEVLMNGRISNGDADFLCENGVKHVNSKNGLERRNDENGMMQVGGNETGKGNLADEFLEDLEEYWEDINDRLTISRMVSDSVIKGMVTAVEREAAEKISSKDLEVANLKKCLQSHVVGAGKYEDVSLPVVQKAYAVGNYGRLSCFTDACSKHEKMREDLHALRSLARGQLKKAKKEIVCARGSNTMKKIGSGAELPGLGGILQEKQPESWMNVDKMLESLKTTVDTICTKVDDILLSSKTTLCESQQDLDIIEKVEDMVMQSALRSLREEFEEKLLEQNVQFSEIQNVNWLEKFNDVSSLGTKLDGILKSLYISETGLVSHGSHDLDHLHHKAFNNHVSPPTSLYGENGTVDESNIHVSESYDYQQLKHMPEEELVNYFNNIITKMRRDHESVLQQKTEEYFRLKRDYLKERGSVMTHRKDEEFDVLRRKIPEAISKLEEFLLENERFPALTNNFGSMEKLKHRLESLLSENRQLRDSLTDKKNEVKCLEAQVLEHSLAEENMLKLVQNLKSTVEDSLIEASVKEEVYKTALREQIVRMRCDSEDSNMEFLITRDIYDIVFREAAIPSETAKRYEIEDSDIELFLMQGFGRLITTEAIKDARRKLDDLYQEILIHKEIINSLETKSLEMENKLRVEVEEKEKLKQEILDLATTMEQKEKSARDLSISLSKEREQFELASQELSSLRENVSQQQTLVAETNMELQSLRSQCLEALEQIKADKREMHILNQKLDETKYGLAEANEEKCKASTLAQEMHDKLLLSEAREETLRKEMEMAANGISKMFDDFECTVSGAIKNCSLRLEDTNSQLKALTKMANVLRITGLTYKQRLDSRCTDLQMAEAEVDLLGDEVDAQLRLLEKIFIALDHYSPVLKHYTGIIEILELVRRELSGESTKLS